MCFMFGQSALEDERVSGTSLGLAPEYSCIRCPGLIPVVVLPICREQPFREVTQNLKFCLELDVGRSIG